MLGIDMTKISRFKNPNKSLIKKILHPNEILEYQKTSDKERFLAQRWSIKEALYKADNNNFHFNKIEIKKVDNTFILPGYIITTTTEDNYYVAVVLKEK